MTAVTEIEAFEAGRTHEVSQFARRVGTGVEFPAVLWAESMNVGPLWRRLQGLAAFTAEDVVRIARALDVEVGVLLG